MQSYYIHFIRHGMTVEDNKGKYIGQTDVPLSKKGIDDLIKYDTLYKYPGVGAVYTSPLLRCVQTCNILYPNIKPEVIRDFAECNFGEWEGKTAKERLQKNLQEIRNLYSGLQIREIMHPKTERAEQSLQEEYAELLKSLQVSL